MVGPRLTQESGVTVGVTSLWLCALLSSGGPRRALCGVAPSLQLSFRTPSYYAALAAEINDRHPGRECCYPRTYPSMRRARDALQPSTVSRDRFED